MQSYKNLDQLIAKSRQYDEVKTDTKVAAHVIRFAEDASLIVPEVMGAMVLGMEDGALGQLGERLGRPFWDQPKRIIPTDFFRQLYGAFPTHFANLTNDLLDKANCNFLLRNYGDKVRAVLSDQYTPFDNTPFLEMTAEVLNGVPYEVVESGKYYSANDGVNRDEMTVRVIVRNVKPEGDSPYGIGVMIRNGETGGGASQVRPLIMRASCLNSIVFKHGEDGERLGLSLHHRGTKATKSVLLASAIAEALPMAEEGLVKFLETKKVEIDLTKVIANIGKDQNWSEEVKLAVATGTEGNASLFGFINGMTWAAHEVELSQQDRFGLESLASKFIYEPRLVR